jgi:hypothetical protein
MNCQRIVWIGVGLRISSLDLNGGAARDQSGDSLRVQSFDCGCTNCVVSEMSYACVESGHWLINKREAERSFDMVVSRHLTGALVNRESTEIPGGSNFVSAGFSRRFSTLPPLIR